MPLVLGVTGNIGSGKSFIGKLLAKVGIPVIDSDHIVHKLYKTNEELQAKVRELCNLPSGGAFNDEEKAQIASQIFAENSEAEEKKQTLESIIHPMVMDFFNKWKEEPEQKGKPIIANLVPLLYEAKLEDRFDKVIAVTVDPETQRQRLMDDTERNLTEQDMEKRIAKQNKTMTQEEKANRADYVIDNSGTRENTQKQLDEILSDLHQKVA